MTVPEKILVLWRRVVASLTFRWNRLARRLRPDSSTSLNPRRNLRGRFCVNPFKQMDVYEDGSAYLCCSNWLPTAIGNLNDSSIDAVWNSEKARRIRASILDGSFRYCDHRLCPFIQNDSLPTVRQAAADERYAELIRAQQTALHKLPGFVNLCNDASCNLWCPSCRTQRINYTDGPELAQRRHLQDRVVQALFAEPTDRHFRVNVTGSGDPFASTVFREFLYGLDGRDFPNLEISLQTNGVLLTPRTWQRLRGIRNNISDILVSFDAATPETYAITRRGGHWPTLLANVEGLGELRKLGELRFLRMDFVVQQANYREMPAFADLARELGADQAGFSMVVNWGTWTAAEFRVRCIWRPDHPEFGRFMEVLADSRLGQAHVDLGNLTEYRARALAMIKRVA